MNASIWMHVRKVKNICNSINLINSYQRVYLSNESFLIIYILIIIKIKTQDYEVSSSCVCLILLPSRKSKWYGSSNLLFRRLFKNNSEMYYLMRRLWFLSLMKLWGIIFIYIVTFKSQSSLSIICWYNTPLKYNLRRNLQYGVVIVMYWHKWSPSEQKQQQQQGKSEGFHSCDRLRNFTQIRFKSSIFQPVWPWNMDDLEK